MTVPASPPTLEDRDLYPLHEEDDVPEIPFHERVVRYLRDALTARFPNRFVTGNACIYWEPRNYADYAAPDVFVAEGWPRHPRPRVYLSFEDPPILFVAEIGSRATRRVDTEEKPDAYSEILAVPEYLFYDPDTEELWLRRLAAGQYIEVAPEETGRLRSETLELEFGVDEEGFLWAYTPEGERLLTHEEEVARRHDAERRAATEAQQREREARRRRRAETVAAEQERLRQEAEQQTREAEARVAELERQLAALRQQSDEEGRS